MAEKQALRFPPSALWTETLRFVRERAVDVPRPVKQALLVLLDFVVLACLAWLSFLLRLDRTFVPNVNQALLMLALPVIAVPVFVRSGVYRSVLRYLPERAIWAILRAVTITILLWVALAFLTQLTGIEGTPRSIPVILWLLVSAYMVCSRFGAKWLLWGESPTSRPPRRTLIYGTGEPAIQLAQALHSAKESVVAGFVTDDRALVGMDVLGLRVYQPGDIEDLVTNMGIREIVITSPAPMTDERREQVARLSQLPAKIRILPPLADIAAGHYLVSSVRDIDIDDLLGRSEVAPDPDLLRAAVSGRTILVTGAAGSIGQAVCRIIMQYRPAKLVLLDLNEHGLYQINRELAQQGPTPVVPVLGSATNRKLLGRLLKESGVEVIFHCAAYKHVRLVEENMLEGISNNVNGTWELAEAAYEAGVDRFVLISSDKAVRPASVMGATKRWSELILHHFSAMPAREGRSTVFCSVRFGNVVGSSGSVVPLFKEQIAKGGPVTVTHDDMTRYFMSVREAAELIVQACALSVSGDILLLEMGEPIRIRELAQDMIRLAGLTIRDDANPDGDIEIVSIGPAKGEKIAEDLFYDPSRITTTAHPKILRAMYMAGRSKDLPSKLQALRAALDRQDAEEVRRILFDAVAEG